MNEIKFQLRSLQGLILLSGQCTQLKSDFKILFEYITYSHKITVKSTPLTISRDEPIVHMAAIMPNAENRDKFILIEKCWTDQQVLLQDFGCSKSELRKVISKNSHEFDLDCTAQNLTSYFQSNMAPIEYILRPYWDRLDVDNK